MPCSCALLYSAREDVVLCDCKDFVVVVTDAASAGVLRGSSSVFSRLGDNSDSDVSPTVTITGLGRVSSLSLYVFHPHHYQMYLFMLVYFL